MLQACCPTSLCANKGDEIGIGLVHWMWLQPCSKPYPTKAQHILVIPSLWQVHIVLVTCLRQACVMCMLLGRQEGKPSFTKCLLQCGTKALSHCTIHCHYSKQFAQLAACLLYYQWVGVVHWKALGVGFAGCFNLSQRLFSHNAFTTMRASNKMPKGREKKLYKKNLR